MARGIPCKARDSGLFSVPFSSARLGERGDISGELFWLFLGVCLSPTPSRQPLFETSDGGGGGLGLRGPGGLRRGFSKISNSSWGLRLAGASSLSIFTALQIAGCELLSFPQILTQRNDEPEKVPNESLRKSLLKNKDLPQETF